MTEEFDTQDIDPIIYLEAYLSKAPQYIQDAWKAFKQKAHEDDVAASVNFEAFKSVREQNDRLLAAWQQNGTGD